MLRESTVVGRGSAGALLLYVLGACSCSHEHEHGAQHGAEAASGHAHVAPRGGELVVLSEEVANAELLLDGTAGTLDLYLLDGHAENPLRSPQSTLVLRFRDGERVELVSVASALSGETIGDSSHFFAAHARFQGSPAFEAVLERVEVRGATYTEVQVRHPGASEHAR